MNTDNFLHQPQSTVSSSDAQPAQSVFGQHPGAEDKNAVRFRRNQGDFSRNKSKLFLGGLVLSLFMVAGGVAYHLSQQAGVGEIRQQASVGTDGWIAFSAKTATGTTQIFSMKEDNGDFQVLSSEVNGESSKHVSYSPDGSKIVYTSNKSGSWNIYMMDADGGNEEQLTTDGGAFYPSFSQDGNKVVYVFESSIGPVKTSQIRVKDIGGSITSLTDVIHAEIHNPLLMLGGSKLIFSSIQAGGVSQIFSYDIGVENSSINQLTTSGGKHPSVFDNHTILFISSSNGVDQVFSIGVDGEDLTQLTFDTTSHYAYPVVSPDATHIAYVARDADGVLPTVAPTTLPTVAPTVLPTTAPTTAPTPTDSPFCITVGDECYNGYAEGTCCSGLYCSHETDNCECVDPDNCPTISPTSIPTTAPTTVPTLTPVPHLTVAPTIPEGSCVGQCLGLPGFECPGGSFLCSPDGLGGCEWTCGEGDVMGVNTSDYQIVIQNLTTGEAWEFSQPHVWQDEYVDSDETMLSPGAWVVPNDASPTATPASEPGLLACGEFGCISNNDCDGDLVCAVIEENEQGYCSEPSYLDSCLAGPSYETCCNEQLTPTSLPTVAQTDPISTITPTSDPEFELGDVALTLKISVENVPYCEGEICHHPLDTHPIFAGGDRKISTKVSILHATVGLSEREVDFYYDETTKEFINITPMVFEDLVAGPYMIFIKGPMHLATKFCYLGESATNLCAFSDLVNANNLYPESVTDFIYLQPGGVTLDLSARPIVVGDLPISGETQDTQDGKINVFDYSFMLSCLGSNSRTEFCLTRADVDYSNQVNNIDLGLLRKALVEIIDEM